GPELDAPAVTMIQRNHIMIASNPLLGLLTTLFVSQEAASASLSTLALAVENNLALPAIAAIGHQSSGKNSVLEALSGVALPWGSGIVTRCPLALKLKKLPHKSKWKGDIQYSGKMCPLTSPSDVEAAVIKAQDEIAGTGVGISHNLISLEISSPDVPDLTLIALPGIARVAVDNQPQDIGQQVSWHETINLVVVPSNIDIATTEALKMAQEVDPQGERALDILTKPDLIDKGTEQEVINIVQNQRVPLRKGYIIVKCHGQNDINDKMSLEEAIQKEKIFFEAHPVFRLTEELIGHIIKSLPALENQIKDKLEVAHMKLQQCGQGVPETMDEQMLYLIEKIQNFSKSISEKVEGQEILMDEQNSRILTGCLGPLGLIIDCVALSVGGILKEVSTFDTKYRGKELPGFVSYRTFQEIVKMNIEMLRSPAIELLKEVAGQFCSDALLSIPKSDFCKEAAFLCPGSLLLLGVHCSFALPIPCLSASAIPALSLYCCTYDCANPLAMQLATVPETSSDAWPLLREQAEQKSTDTVELWLHNHAGIRIGTQIPMIIRTCVLHDCAEKLQTAYDFLLQEEKHVAGRRTRVKEQISRLTKAQRCLVKFPI
uniref:MX dynamin like GTPase 1 n=1 Tax=Varanus komodoensis TaxID=61221 RepID=A0A8D2LJJ9_VARKO